MLAELDDPASAIPGGQLVKLTENTITDSGRLKEQLADIRAKGQASEVNELEVGSASLALPVRQADGSVGAAVCLTGPAERFSAIAEHTEAASDLTVRLSPLQF
jgi:DNA-binding IclR family transcriptional regulator